MATTGPGAADPLRIGFFVPWITQGRGGTENVGHMMANAMATRGHGVTVFTFDDGQRPPLWPLDPAIRLIRLPEAAEARADRQMAAEVAACGPDLLVGLHMNRTFLRYVRCALKLGLPIVLSEHIDPRYPDWTGSFTPEERRLAFSGATRIHLLAEAFRATLPARLHPRIRVIPNTVRPPQILAAPGRRRGTKSLLAVARLVPRKNLATLLDAFARLDRDFPDWRLDLVGDGPQMHSLKARAKARGIARRVRFHGALADPYPRFARAELFVIPSHVEGCPMSVCEAMAHGLPVVGFAACTGINLQVAHGETGLLAEGADQAAALAAALRPLMADADLRRRMGQAGRARHDDLFSNPVVFDAWEALFLEAAHAAAPCADPSQEEIARVRLHDLAWGPPAQEARA